jgi:hypothetical protein
MAKTQAKKDNSNQGVSLELKSELKKDPETGATILEDDGVRRVTKLASGTIKTQQSVERPLANASVSRGVR